MDNIHSSSPSSVPSIRIHDADDASALFDSGDMFSTDICSLYNLVSEDTGLYTCPPLRSEYYSPNAPSHPSADLEDIPELSHLSTMNQVYLTGHGYSLPYPAILREPGATVATDDRLSPSTLGSPIPSPTSSFGSSLSPSSLYDSFALSDSESPVPPSPATSDQQFLWSEGLNHHSSDSLVLHPSMGSFPNDSIRPSSLGPEVGPRRARSTSSSSSRPGPVATKAMLDANSRRRRHPAQFECPDCGQTFTALFSLKRHAQSHTGTRPFTCSIPGCTQQFFNSSDCKRHEKSKKRHKDLLMS